MKTLCRVKRSSLRTSQVDYTESKSYPFLPRYFMLKDMIRDVITDPTFIELSHEAHEMAPPVPGSLRGGDLSSLVLSGSALLKVSYSQPNSPSQIPSSSAPTTSSTATPGKGASGSSSAAYQGKLQKYRQFSISEG